MKKQLSLSNKIILLTGAAGFILHSRDSTLGYHVSGTTYLH